MEKALTHEEVMVLIRLTEKAAKVMHTLSEEDIPFEVRLFYRRAGRQFDTNTNYVRNMVFKLTEGEPRHHLTGANCEI